jgi:hypothetical protein
MRTGPVLLCREAQEAGGADDDMDAYAADGPAETVEDLLK